MNGVGRDKGKERYTFAVHRGDLAVVKLLEIVVSLDCINRYEFILHEMAD